LGIRPQSLIPTQSAKHEREIGARLLVARIEADPSYAKRQRTAYVGSGFSRTYSRA